ncbi:MAG TPA: circadian clock KaiB family protein [Adhaeribacter sp.]|nr:circadian clock KaiB family protein [Adhaeribacter sp.]
MAKYSIQLYISSNTATSIKALELLNGICTEYLNGDCDVEVIDILEHPEKAEELNILAIPTLIRKWPLPEVRMIGALNVKTRLLTGLGIEVDEA